MYDACILYPFHLRNLAANTPTLSIERLIATLDRMKAVLPEADITNDRTLVPDLKLPDPDGRHVLSAAIVSKASLIVTRNLKDFPARDLRSYGVSSQSPDDFLTELHAALPDALISSVKRARHNLRKTTPSVEAFVDVLQQSGLKTFSGMLCRNIAALK